MKNAADDAPVIDPLLAAHVPWQMRFDPAPLLITKPKQIAAHLPAPKSPVAGNQQSILTSTLLLGSRPSYTVRVLISTQLVARAVSWSFFDEPSGQAARAVAQANSREKTPVSIGLTGVLTLSNEKP
jgi:hypothetical protein